MATPLPGYPEKNDEMYLNALLLQGAPASYSHIATNTTTTVKNAPGTLVSVTVNTKGASANTATIYDNTAASGTVIAVIDTTVVASYRYNLATATGITVVTATGTAADLTVTYQ